jgi:hypothetical protein
MFSCLVIPTYDIQRNAIDPNIVIHYLSTAAMAWIPRVITFTGLLLLAHA